MTPSQQHLSSTPSARLDDAGIRRFTLRFSDPALEARYQREDALANRLVAKQWAIAGMLVYAALGGAEVFFMGHDVGLALGVRYGLCLPLFVLGYVLSFHVNFERFFPIVMPFNLTVAAVTTAVVYTAVQPEYRGLYLYMFVCTVLFTYLHSGITFWIKTVVGWTSCAMFLAIALASGVLGWTATDVLRITVILVTNSMAMFGTQAQELANRRLFRANLVLARQRQLDEERQRQLQTSNRLESVGRLAGGVAHDFNNLMQIIASHAYLAAKKAAGTPSRGAEELDGILSAVHRGGDLTRRLLAFSRQQVFDKRVTDLRRVVDEIQHMLQHTINKNINVAIDIPAGEMFVVLADPGAMDQVLLNLAINACDAMPAGGDLRIALGKTRAVPGFPAGPVDLPQMIRIDVTDSGVGIPAGLKDKVFDPFFTTKEVGKGTGLGLSIVFGIVKDHDGHIELTDAVPRGTTASVFIPACDRPEPGETASATAKEGAASSRVILLAEDEGELATGLRRMLESAGHRVVLAADGEQAIAAVRRSPGAFDIAVLDIAMPKSDGFAVYAEIRRAMPETPVIISSGYHATRHEPAVKHDRRVAFLDKPYAPADLLRKIEAMLAAGEGTPHGADR